MKVFVTGATGFIGSAVVKELLGAGHQVLGLTRSEEGAKALEAVGAEVHRGTLEDLDSLQKGAAAAEGVIHTAFIHDFSNFKANCEIDRKAIVALGDALAGTHKALVITSGIGLLPSGRLVTEADKPLAGSSAIPRVASEEATDEVVAKGVRASIVRLPPSVHGKGDHGFVPALIGMAREKGVSGYIGEGLNHWPAVHRLDAARLYRLALEKGTAGARYHGIGDTGIPTKDIAAVIGQQLNLPVVSIAKEEAAAHFTWLAHFFALDVPASAKQTAEQLGWQPSEIGLLEDLKGNNGYFSA